MDRRNKYNTLACLRLVYVTLGLIACTFAMGKIYFNRPLLAILILFVFLIIGSIGFFLASVWYILKTFSPQKVPELALADEISINTFLRIAANLNEDYTGVYVIHNLTKDMYYVGQGVKVFARAKKHFSGSGGGNGDVYADYKYGDVFGIRIVLLNNSGFNSLNALEKHLINKFDAYRNGYNRTSGNN